MSKHNKKFPGVAVFGIIIYMFLGETEKIKCCKSPVGDARKVYRINNLLFGSRLHILVLVAVAERKNTTLEFV